MPTGDAGLRLAPAPPGCARRRSARCRHRSGSDAGSRSRVRSGPQASSAGRAQPATRPASTTTREPRQAGEEGRQAGQGLPHLGPARGAVPGARAHGSPTESCSRSGCRGGRSRPRQEAEQVGGGAGRVVARDEAGAADARTGRLQEEQQAGRDAAVEGVGIGHLGARAPRRSARPRARIGAMWGLSSRALRAARAAGSRRLFGSAGGASADIGDEAPQALGQGALPAEALAAALLRQAPDQALGAAELEAELRRVGGAGLGLGRRGPRPRERISASGQVGEARAQGLLRVWSRTV